MCSSGFNSMGLVHCYQVLGRVGVSQGLMEEFTQGYHSMLFTCNTSWAGQPCPASKHIHTVP